jgi:hypothetical protein
VKRQEAFLTKPNEDGLDGYGGYGFTIRAHDPHDAGRRPMIICLCYARTASSSVVGTWNGLNWLDRAAGTFTGYERDP